MGIVKEDIKAKFQFPKIFRNYEDDYFAGFIYRYSSLKDVCIGFRDSALVNIPYLWCRIADKYETGDWTCSADGILDTFSFEEDKDYANKLLAALIKSIEHDMRNGAPDVVRRLRESFFFSESGSTFFVRMENPDASVKKSTLCTQNEIFDDDGDYVEMEFTLRDLDESGASARFVAGFHPTKKNARELYEYYGSDVFWKDPFAVTKFLLSANLFGARLVANDFGVPVSFGVPVVKQEPGFRYHISWVQFALPGVRTLPGAKHLSEIYSYLGLTCCRVVGTGEEQTPVILPDVEAK